MKVIPKAHKRKHTNKASGKFIPNPPAEPEGPVPKKTGIHQLNTAPFGIPPSGGLG